MKTHVIAVLATGDVVPFDIAVPLQVFRHVPGRPYQVQICAPEAGTFYHHCGMRIAADRGLDLLEEADTVVVPGLDSWERPAPPAVLEALRQAATAGKRIASICTGAFILAQAGLLRDRRATTHWACAAHLKRQFPDTQVDANVLYLADGNIITSAGVTAGIDMCLHLVRQDHGQQAANHAARMIVASPHRSGGQAQFIERPLPPERSRSLDRTRQWMLAHLDTELHVADMAQHAGLATRSFARRFEAETGLPPLQWLIERRVEHARTLLETTALPVDVVAVQCGFGSALSFRQHFKRNVRLTPTDYRRTFSADKRPARVG